MLVYTHATVYLLPQLIHLAKDKVFPYGECLDATIKDAYQCIICITIKLNNMINIKCDSF